jgi:hypothetical protein
LADSDPAKFLGKHLLVGITVLDHEGKLVEQYQVHGIIDRIEEEGITIKQASGEEFGLPPDLSNVEVAAPGTYKLRSTGEELVDPDFVSSWTVYEPDPSEKGD